jgi:hypothetical protein
MAGLRGCPKGVPGRSDWPVALRSGPQGRCRPANRPQASTESADDGRATTPVRLAPSLFCYLALACETPRHRYAHPSQTPRRHIHARPPLLIHCAPLCFPLARENPCRSIGHCGGSRAESNRIKSACMTPPPSWGRHMRSSRFMASPVSWLSEVGRVPSLSIVQHARRFRSCLCRPIATLWRPL